jgi:peptide-methionine (S)-S-oxide reductase
MLLAAGSIVFCSEGAAHAKEAKMERAIFAAGCFWGVEETFRQVRGVVRTEVGYTGGDMRNPSYEDVCTDRTGHAEAVLVEFNPDEISYDELLDLFWKNHDPTTRNRQGPDVGRQYRSAIFYFNEKQRAIAEASKGALEGRGRFQAPIVTEIAPAGTFWPAEEYHQKYHLKRGGGSCAHGG